METPRTQYVERDGVKIAWQVFGEGPAEILFVPGWVANVDLFWQFPQPREFFTELASFARVADRGIHKLKGIPEDWQLYALA